MANSKALWWAAASLAALGCAPSIDDAAVDLRAPSRDLAGGPSDAGADARADMRRAPPDLAGSYDFSWTPPDLAGGGPDLALPSCDKPSGMRHGSTMRSIVAAGLQRTYLVYLPTNVAATKPIPLVFVFHGFTMSGQLMHDITLYTDIADREGVALVFPDGQGGPNTLNPPWNVGAGVCGIGAIENAAGDDFAFVEAMRADVECDQAIDRAHVFATGFSMGGYFSHQVGCMRPDLVRAIAPHSGGTHDFAGCVGGHKPVMMFHGLADGVIDPNCAKSARDQWVRKNGCRSTVSTVAVKGGRCEWSDGCPADGQVVLCLFDGLEHAWAGGAPGVGSSNPNYESATRLQWTFFKQHAW